MLLKNAPMNTANPIAKKNMEVISEFFSIYLVDKKRFYSLWVEKDPVVVTPFVSDDVAVLHSARHVGWDAVKGFWDPIHDEMKGKFDWAVEEYIAGENPNFIITKSRSEIDVFAGATWGNKHVKYNGRYVQLFTFENNKVKSFEEYYDTALLNASYS